MDDTGSDIRHAIAEQVQRRLVEELERAYEEAGVQGLCGEGALEYALDRVRSLDPHALVPEGQPAASDREQS